MRRRSTLMLSGMTMITLSFSCAPSMASAMPVLPLVASISTLSLVTSPRSIARFSIQYTARSLTLPPGLNPSSLTYTFESPIWIIGVFPISSIGFIYVLLLFSDSPPPRFLATSRAIQERLLCELADPAIHETFLLSIPYDIRSACRTSSLFCFT